MKCMVTLMVATLFILIPSCAPAFQAGLTLKPMFSTLEDVTLKDDAFHGQGQHAYAEWWYFDAVLDNGYSLTFGVKVFDVLDRGGVNTRVDVYQEGARIAESEQTSSLKQFSASREIPSRITLPRVPSRCSFSDAPRAGNDSRKQVTGGSSCSLAPR
jgi:hypothetical protein